MRNALFTITLVSITFQSFAQWNPVASGTLANLQDVYFPTDSIGYAVGQYGTVLKSTDAGNSWSISAQDSSYHLFSVHFTNPDIGFAAGGKLYATTDGGSNWAPILTDSLDAMSVVYFVNDSLGFASGGLLYRTTNGGSSWNSTNLNNVFASIYFPSDSIGYFVGGTSMSDLLYRTSDGGLTFTPITNGFQSIKEASYFLNDTVGYMCGWYGGTLVKTTDSGSQWQDIGDSLGSQCWDVYFVDENTGYYIQNGGGTYQIRVTTDGGVNWTGQLFQPSIAWLEAFWFLDAQTAVAVGDSGKIYRTFNGGGLTGLREQRAEARIRIYPNPAEDMLTIACPDDGDYSLVVYSSVGQEMYRLSAVHGHHRLDVGGFPEGIYFAVVSDAGGARTALPWMKR